MATGQGTPLAGALGAPPGPGSASSRPKELCDVTKTLRRLPQRSRSQMEGPHRRPHSCTGSGPTQAALLGGGSPPAPRPRAQVRGGRPDTSPRNPARPEWLAINRGLHARWLLYEREGPWESPVTCPQLSLLQNPNTCHSPPKSANGHEPATMTPAHRPPVVCAQRSSGETA